MIADKVCPKCHERKSADQFYKAPTRSDGLSSYCRKCQVADAKDRYAPSPRERLPEGQKFCPRCKTVKSKDEFGNNRSQFDGKQSVCKPCAVAAVTASRHKDPTSHRRSSKAWREANPERHADMHAKWKYGVEHGTYATMLEAQDGRCAICGTDQPGGNAKRFHIDHCHNSTTVRGLLCAGCNTGLGQFKDEPERLRAAADYIEKARLS